MPISETEALALVDAIEQVSKGQPADTALKLVEMALVRAPQQPLVLNAAGGYMYRNGNARRARDLFEKAVAVDGNSKVLWLNLANACRTLGDKKSAAQALEKALAIDPRYVLALLLMRRKRLKFEEARYEGDQEVLQLRCAKTGAQHRIVNPRLSEVEMGAVQEEVFKVLGWR